MTDDGEMIHDGGFVDSYVFDTSGRRDGTWFVAIIIEDSPDNFTRIKRNAGSRSSRDTR